MYVVMPVPASVRAAITPGSCTARDDVPQRSDGKLQSKDATPRLANGKPDLTGNWGGGGMNWRYGNRRCGPTQLEGCSPQWNQTMDFEFEAPSRFGPNRPLYKPEHWDKVQQLDMWTNKEDPVMTCQPLGIPRQGPPRRIIQSATTSSSSTRNMPMAAADRGNTGSSRSTVASTTSGRLRDDHVHGLYRGPLGRRYARARLGRVQRLHVARARRLLPFRRDAGGGALHASGQ